MQAIEIFDAKLHFSALIERVISGEKILLTKKGQVVAAIIPIVDMDHVETENVIQRILSFQNCHTLGLNWKELRNDGLKPIWD